MHFPINISLFQYLELRFSSTVRTIASVMFVVDEVSSMLFSWVVFVGFFLLDVFLVWIHLTFFRFQFNSIFGISIFVGGELGWVGNSRINEIVTISEIQMRNTVN